jgi:hypothetical protein
VKPRPSSTAGASTLLAGGVLILLLLGAIELQLDRSWAAELAQLEPDRARTEQAAREALGGRLECGEMDWRGRPVHDDCEAPTLAQRESYAAFHDVVRAMGDIEAKRTAVRSSSIILAVPGVIFAAFFLPGLPDCGGAKVPVEELAKTSGVSEATAAGAMFMPYLVAPLLALVVVAALLRRRSPARASVAAIVPLIVASPVARLLRDAGANDLSLFTAIVAIPAAVGIWPLYRAIQARGWPGFRWALGAYVCFSAWLGVFSLFALASPGAYGVGFLVAGLLGIAVAVLLSWRRSRPG